MHQDPVCGMMVEPSTAAGTYEYGGTTYAFCSAHCLERVRAHPEQYVAPSRDTRTSTPVAGAVYTCPMHPEVRQETPGACPICGMALEPVMAAVPRTRTAYVCPMHPEIVRSEPGVCPICGMALEPQTVSAEEEVNPELLDMTRRFWISLGLTAPLLVLAMAEMVPGRPVQQALSARLLTWLQLVCATPVVLWGGWPFFVRGWASVVNRRLNMFTLIAMGTGTAYVYSVIATLVPDIFPDSFRGHSGEVAVYFEAAAIVAGAQERGLALVEAQNFRSVTGKGVIGHVDGRRVALGNRALFLELGLALGEFVQHAEGLRRDGQTVMFVAVNDEPAGLLGVADPIKASTPEALRLLREDGVQVIMLTGDGRTTAEAVARTLGIERVEAEVLPEQKGEVVQRLQTEGRVVAMAGDGVNDAPALAQAHVGIAMGTGTDVAVESAGVTLVKGDLRGIVRARRLSQGTMRNIRQNLFFAFMYNTLGIPIAAGVLYPVWGLLLNPMLASAAMTVSSVSVIGNALRLRRLPL